MSTPSLFEKLDEGKVLLEVGTDDLKVWVPDTGKWAVGTKHLNGCTCVVILGSTAILMAHISPYSGRFEEHTKRNLPRESHEHHETALADVAKMVRQHRSRFPPSATAWGIFAYGKEGTSSSGYVESIKNQVQEHLHQIGYNMRPAFYEEMNVSEISPAKGELVAFFQAGVAQLILERQRLWPKQQSVSSSSFSSLARSLVSLSPAATDWQASLETNIGDQSVDQLSSSPSTGRQKLLVGDVKKLQDNYEVTLHKSDNVSAIWGILSYGGQNYKILLSETDRKIAFDGSDVYWPFVFAGDDDLQFRYTDSTGRSHTMTMS